MNILNFHKNLVDSYKSYIQSFINIKDPRILEFVEKEINNKKLWPEPLVQFNPTFESAKPITDLCDEGTLHREFKHIFASFRNLIKHQEEAIRMGVGGKEFVVTSGTGSGKYLTYKSTIFNHVLHQGSSVDNKIIAVVVYPINALINSQFGELQKYEINYFKSVTGIDVEESAGITKPGDIIAKYHSLTSLRFPITYAQFTGQESEELREMERNEKKATRQQVLKLAKALETEEKELMTFWLSDKIVETVNEESEAYGALKLTEKRLKEKK